LEQVVERQLEQRRIGDRLHVAEEIADAFRFRPGTLCDREQLFPFGFGAPAHGDVLEREQQAML
jgi:hypothetical protein